MKKVVIALTVLLVVGGMTYKVMNPTQYHHPRLYK